MNEHVALAALGQRRSIFGRALRRAAPEILVEEAQYVGVLDCATGRWTLVRVLDPKGNAADPDIGGSAA
jgi:hypothetical protein